MTLRNQQLFELSQRYIPGGVNSPVRAFKSVGGEPVSFSGEKGLIFGMLMENLMWIMLDPGDRSFWGMLIQMSLKRCK